MQGEEQDDARSARPERHDRAPRAPSGGSGARFGLEPSARSKSTARSGSSAERHRTLRRIEDPLVRAFETGAERRMAIVDRGERAARRRVADAAFELGGCVTVSMPKAASCSATRTRTAERPQHFQDRHGLRPAWL